MAPASPRPRWSIVLPYYNEEAFIAGTLRSLLAMRGRPVRLILVDNGSTDATETLCRRMLDDAPGIEVRYLLEEQPGPVHALHAGFAAVDTPLVAFWNADTTYPPDYLVRASALLDRPGVVAAMAVGLDSPPSSWRGRWLRFRKFATSLILVRQSHTGTFGQCFRTDALRAAGGPRSDDWPWVLDDHEVMQRVFKIGRSRYHPDFWCRPSDRRASSAHVRWTLFERIMYHATPFRAKDWFFHSFLGPRFQARGMDSANLRVRCWEDRAPHGGA
ncbi:glycosyltransferase family 2 protein [Sphingomonas bacterium]|uniref:glycosyltransferase family 2 protein n=1 Tax=Sphingomonas bacterium TaxID=1895847 RepID=UPI001576D7E7|nr:glycosyltransferase family A protein [Sphingomonas bacterium]